MLAYRHIKWGLVSAHSLDTRTLGFQVHSSSNQSDLCSSVDIEVAVGNKCFSIHEKNLLEREAWHICSRGEFGICLREIFTFLIKRARNLFKWKNSVKIYRSDVSGQIPIGLPTACEFLIQRRLSEARLLAHKLLFWFR